MSGCAPCDAQRAALGAATTRDLTDLIRQAEAVRAEARRIPASIVVPRVPMLQVWDADRRVRDAIDRAIYSFLSTSIYDRDRQWNDDWIAIRDRYHDTFIDNLGRYVPNVRYARDPVTKPGDPITAVDPKTDRVAMPDARFAASIAKDMDDSIAVLKLMNVQKAVIEEIFGGFTSGRNWADDLGDALGDAATGLGAFGAAMLRLLGDAGRGVAGLFRVLGWAARNAIPVGLAYLAYKLLAAPDRRRS